MGVVTQPLYSSKWKNRDKREVLSALITASCFFSLRGAPSLSLRSHSHCCNVLPRLRLLISGADSHHNLYSPALQSVEKLKVLGTPSWAGLVCRTWGMTSPTYFQNHGGWSCPTMAKLRKTLHSFFHWIGIYHLVLSLSTLKHTRNPITVAPSPVTPEVSRGRKTLIKLLR